MSDAQILDLIVQADGAPRRIEGDQKFILAGDGAIVLVLQRVGRGERWALHSRGIVRLEGGKVPAAKAWQFSLAALRWVYQGARLNVAQHGRAMGARTL